MKSPRRVWAVSAGLLLVGSLAACSSNSASPTASTSSSSPSASAASMSAAASSAPSSQAVTVMTAKSSLGTILVDGKGMTLYLFTKDTQGSGTSTCEAGCLAAWPPLLGKPTAGTGADQTMLGTLTRTDGTSQVTYNGWPLYYWAQDSAPGQTTGQGVQNVWWVVSPTGAAIGAK
jgi:predicted lipoprotein with Yx(FWY)xxD motif